VLRETTSPVLCELVCPSRTNERGGEGYCVKEGVCVCLLLQDLVQSCLRGEGGILEDMCYEKDVLQKHGSLGLLRSN
jgi:hypothetical protein